MGNSRNKYFSNFYCWSYWWTNQAQMTKSQKYRIYKEFKRKTFDTNPKKRLNYVHQVVRFNAYLIIE